MSKAIKVITTVGTSLFTNCFKKADSSDLKEAYEDIEDGKYAADRIVDSDLEDCIEDLKDGAMKHWMNADASAEISSIISLKEKFDKEKLEVVLLATDTVLSRLACQLLVERFQKGNHPIEGVKVSFGDEYGDGIVKGLSVFNPKEFEEQGIQNLLAQINKLRKNQEKVILNISGGYKGVLPILTIFAQINKIPLYYKYEESPGLIEIDPMPIGFDWKAIQGDLSYIQDLSKINNETIREKMVKKHLVKESGDKVELSTMGKMVQSFLEENDPPLFNDILGYLVEYKVFEYYLKTNHYSKVVHGFIPEVYKEENGMDDIDILLEPKDATGFIAIEMKPFGRLKSGFKKIIEKLCERAQKAKEELSQELGGLWVILYDKDKSQPELTDSQHNQIAEAQKCIHSVFGKELPFQIKYFNVPINEIDGQTNRMKYHNFLRSSLAEGSIITLYEFPVLQKN